MFTSELWNGKAASRYAIDQSIRFNDDDSAYMYKTFGSAGDNRRKYTISVWFKIGEKGDGSSNTERNIFMAGAYGNDDGITLDQNDKIKFSANGTSSANLISNQVLRDHSAFYHVMVAVDTTQATSSNRVKMYLNGSQITSFATENYPSQNYDGNIINNVQHNIGARTGSNRHFDGYLAEIHLLDGFAYDPSYFGETTSEGIWIPKQYTGSYGTNGFKIDGRDASDLGDDESGNGHDFTTSGLAAHDQVLDTPTNNFCVLTPLATLMDSGSTLSNGNLKIVLSGNDQFHSNFEISEKAYCEVRLDASSNYGGALGFGTFQGSDDDDNTIVFSMNYLSGRINLGNGSSGGDVGGNVSVGDIIMMALDPDTRKWWVGVNGTWRNSGDPAGGTGHVYQYATDYFDPSSSYSTTEGIGAIVWGGFKGSANGMTVTWNFGQEGTFGGQETAGGNADGNGNGNFKYTVPSGFKALCSKSMGS